jgi:hypothetical protein
MITIPAANAQTITRILLLVVLSSFLLLTACGKSSSDGEVRNEVELPTDDTQPFSLYCQDIGLFGEDCVLEDPDNPYARSAVSEDTKFDLDADAPSATAKFYLWATALANGAGAGGENQFYVALNLHRMWASNNSELTRLQALRAYQSYLDNFLDSVTFFEIPVGSGETFPFSLNEFTGEMLFDPADITNTFTSTRLFNPDPDINRSLASQQVGEWGFYFDQDTEIFTRNF